MSPGTAGWRRAASADAVHAQGIRLVRAARRAARADDYPVAHMAGRCDPHSRALRAWCSMSMPSSRRSPRGTPPRWSRPTASARRRRPGTALATSEASPPGRPGRGDHRSEHLGGNDDRPGLLPGQPDHPLLCHRNLIKRRFDAGDLLGRGWAECAEPARVFRASAGIQSQRGRPSVRRPGGRVAAQYPPRTTSQEREERQRRGVGADRQAPAARVAGTSRPRRSRPHRAVRATGPAAPAMAPASCPAIAPASCPAIAPASCPAIAPASCPAIAPASCPAIAGPAARQAARQSPRPAARRPRAAAQYEHGDRLGEQVLVNQPLRKISLPNGLWWTLPKPPSHSISEGDQFCQRVHQAEAKPRTG